MSFDPPSSRPFSINDRPRPHEWVKVQNVGPAKTKGKRGSLLIPILIIAVCVAALAGIAVKALGGSTQNHKPAQSASANSAGNGQPVAGGQLDVSAQPVNADTRKAFFQVTVLADRKDELDSTQPLEIDGPGLHFVFGKPQAEPNNTWRVALSFVPNGERSGAFKITGVRYASQATSKLAEPKTVSWQLAEPAKPNPKPVTPPSVSHRIETRPPVRHVEAPKPEPKPQQPVEKKPTFKDVGTRTYKGN